VRPAPSSTAAVVIATAASEEKHQDNNQENQHDGTLLLLPVDSLLGRLAVELFAVGLRIDAGMVDDAVSMIRRRKAYTASTEHCRY
jgi:hypothetical protein